MRAWTKATLGLGLAAGTTLVWANLETHLFRVRTHEVPVLPHGVSPKRILHISDLHLVPNQHDKISWLRDLVEETKPDLVINTGDNLAHLQALPAVLHALEHLLEVPGVFVFGSNDYFAPVWKNPVHYLAPDRFSSGKPQKKSLPAKDLANAFASHGWLNLNNATGSIDFADLALDFVGTGDAHIGLDKLPELNFDERGAGFADELPRLRVGVTHSPYLKVLDDFVASDCDLIFAGHTHGGQLQVPFFGAIITNCDLDRGRVSGLHGYPGPRPDSFGGQNSKWLHVCQGLGTSPYFPFRFCCRPEANLIVLTELENSATQE